MTMTKVLPALAALGLLLAPAIADAQTRGSATGWGARSELSPECGVLGNVRPAPLASVVGEIVPHAEWYDYAAKYDAGGSDIIVPARILGGAAAERGREQLMT